MIKNFPKSRICVIDCNDSFKNGLQKAYNFAKKNNITLNSSDGRRLILGFCLKNIEETYKTTKSVYPKVMCISENTMSKKLIPFVENYFDKMMAQVPIPYCGKFELNSPDLEMAAESSLKQQKTNRKFQEFLSKIKLKSN